MNLAANVIPKFIFFVSSILFLMLGIWGKPFSYIAFAGIYITELVMAFLMILYLFYVFLKRKLKFPKQNLVNASLLWFLLFGAISLFSIINTENINLKALIPFIYPFYFFPLYLTFRELDERNQKILINGLIYFFCSYFFIVLLFKNGLLSFVNDLLPNQPGGGSTFRYGIALAASILLVKSRLFRIIFVFSTALGLILLFQRGAILCFLAAFFIGSWGKGIKRGLYVLFTSGFMIIFITVVGIFLAEYLISTFGFASRFDLSIDTFLVFVGSIFNDSYDLESERRGLLFQGTRNHRLDMWQAIIEYNMQNTDRFIFGNGMSGEIGDILGISFRSPHNGLVTIFFRLGLIGVIAYIGIIFTLLYKLLRLRINSTSPNEFSLLYKAKIFGLIVFGSFISDAMTGTIVDSPFTQYMFIFSIAASFAVLERRKYA